MRPLPRRQGYRIVQSILQLQKTDERLIWNWQKLILANKLRLCVNELKKPIMAVFLLHLFVRLSRTFLLEDWVWKSWLSPFAPWVLYLFLYLLFGFSFAGKRRAPIGITSSEISLEPKCLWCFWRWNQNRGFKNRTSPVWTFIKNFNSFWKRITYLTPACVDWITYHALKWQPSLLLFHPSLDNVTLLNKLCGNRSSNKDRLLQGAVYFVRIADS